ncbi:hypothetical protein [Sulfuracidifex metallicus]|uniref:hypothetical protein n=1 Tax=Sulfuracidifex metallicus TaxID=47303 RepID=UPI000A62F95F
MAENSKWAPRFQNVDKALEIPNVQVRLFGKPSTYPKRRMGVIISTAETVGEALEKVRKASALIVVN